VSAALAGQITPVAGQPGSSTPAGNASNLWLMLVAGALLLFGGVLLLGRRRKDSGK
jgi:LPXTG-motif cell wall-anchored protein